MLKTKQGKNSCIPNVCLKDMSVININISVLCRGKSGSSNPKLLPEILLEHDTGRPGEGKGLSYLISQNHTHHPGRARDYRTFQFRVFFSIFQIIKKSYHSTWHNTGVQKRVAILLTIILSHTGTISFFYTVCLVSCCIPNTTVFLVSSVSFSLKRLSL